MDTIDTFLYVRSTEGQRGERGVRAYGFFPFHLPHVTVRHKPPIYSICMQTKNMMRRHAVHCREFRLTVITNSGVKLQSAKVVSVLSDSAILCVRSKRTFPITAFQSS